MDDAIRRLRADAQRLAHGKPRSQARYWSWAVLAMSARNR